MIPVEFWWSLPRRNASGNCLVVFAQASAPNKRLVVFAQANASAKVLVVFTQVRAVNICGLFTQARASGGCFEWSLPRHVGFPTEF